MADVTKDIAFGGLEDYAPENMKDFARELSRRLEQFANSQFYQLRSQPTLFTNEPDDEPVGMKEGDIWINLDGTRRYNGLAWVGT